jgi:hypothetical protein
VSFIEREATRLGSTSRIATHAACIRSSCGLLHSCACSSPTPSTSFGASMMRTDFLRPWRFTPHHCDLKLETVSGRFDNVIATQSQGGWLSMSSFMFSSKINGGNGGFEREGRVERFSCTWHTVLPGLRVHMGSKELHTVKVPAGMVSAWLVTEGTEDLRYKPISWSFQELPAQASPGLYQPLTSQEADRLIDMALTSESGEGR